MKKPIIPLLFLLLALPAFGAGVERITLTVTITNVPVSGNTLTINASARTWTNASAAATILTNLVSTNYAATNLYNQIASFPYAGPLILQYASSNQIRLIGPLGGALAGSASGGWADITLSTQSGPQTYTALWPIENMTGPTNRTNQASALVSGLSTFSTNAFATNSTAVSNHLTKGASPRQHVSSPITFNGGFSGILEKMTNGYGTNTVLDAPTTTNLVNRGNAIRSEGLGGNSLQLGSNALAVGNLSMAGGNGALASNANATAIGTGAKATNTSSTAVGNAAIAGGDYAFASGYSASATASSATAIGAFAGASGSASTAVGNLALATEIGSTAVGSEDTRAFGPYSFAGAAGAIATKHSGVALGYSASSGHSNSTALGYSATTTTTNEVRLGTSADTVSIPGVLEVSGTQTNTVFSGTNKFQLAISLSATNITTLANGANDLDPGFKTYLRVSGPSAAYSIDKIDRGYDGRILIIQKTDSLTMTVVNNSGAGVLGDAAKVLTGTGATRTITNNPGFVELIYDATASRWGIRNSSN